MSTLGITENPVGQLENGDKPGMGVENSTPNGSQKGAGQPGALPRGPRKAKPGFRHLGVQLTAELYAKVVEVARAEGSGTSAFVRRLVADHLDDPAVVDRIDGARVPPAELASASILLGHLTRLVIASRDLGDGQAAGAIAAMVSAHKRLVRIIERMEG